MPTIGLPELIVIGMILLLVFGASRLPQLGEGLGKTIGKLRRSLKEDGRIEVEDGSSAQATPTPATQPDPAVEAAEDAELVEDPRDRS